MNTDKPHLKFQRLRKEIVFLIVVLLNLISTSAFAGLSCGTLYTLKSGKITTLVSPYTAASEGNPPIATGLGGVNALGINPLDLNKIYYFDISSPATTPATNTLFYYDVTTGTAVGSPVATTFVVPSGAGNSLAFSSDGYAYAYDYTTGKIYSQKSGTYSSAITTLMGTGMPSTVLSQYKVNDVVMDASGKMYMIGLYPAGTPTSAHLLQIDPTSGVATYIKSLTVTPSSPFPDASSGLAFATNSMDASPKFVWTGSGTYDIDVNAGTAIRATSNSQADLASCVFSTIGKSATLQLKKTWGANSIAGDIASIGASTGGTNNTNAFTSTASTGSDSGSAVSINAGDTITLAAETMSTGTLANYSTTLACTADGGATANSLSGTNGQVSNTLAIGAADAGKAIVCTYTNTRKTATLKLVKTWSANSIAGDTVTVASTGLTNNASSGVSTATVAGNTTTGTTVTVYAGETASLSETFGTGSSANYSSSLACSGNGTALSGSTLSINAADTAITCTYTNTRRKIDTVKAVGVALQTGIGKFEIAYNVVLGNKGAATVYNVQANDNLSNTFAAPATYSIKTGSYSVTPTGGTCAGNTAFNGGTDTKLLAGTDDWSTGQSCSIKYTVLVDYGTNVAPATRYNSALASGMGTDSATANPGYTGITQDPITGVITGGTPPVGYTTTDISSTAPATTGIPGTAPVTPSLPSTPGGDTPAPTPVGTVVQKIDTVKAVGVALQTGIGKFEIAYNVVLGNKGAATVYNVQANDNLSNTFAAPATYSIKTGSYSVTPTGGTCAGNTAFNGGTDTKLLAGTDDWSTGQSCSIKYTVLVDYGTNVAPATRYNSALASGMGTDSATANPGYTGITQDPITGVITGGTPPVGYTTTDISSTAPATTGIPGTAPVTPSLPSTPGGDTPAPTPVGTVVQKIDTVKAVGVPKQVGPKVFELSYSVVVANVCKSAPLGCAATPTVFNVQANDNLALTFPTASTVTVSNYAVTNGANGAVCTPAASAFLGTAAASSMLSGVNDLLGGQTCIITFKATVDFGVAAIPKISQNNSVYASGVGSDAISNPGYVFSSTGLPIPPGFASTTDISSTAPATSGPPGTLPITPLPPLVAGGDSDTGISTDVIFVIEDDGELVIKKSTTTKLASAGDVVEYSIVVGNTGSNAVRTNVTDKPPAGFEYVAGTAKVNGVAIANPTTANGELIFDIGLVAATSSIELRYQMKLGDGVEGGEASNCVVARGINVLTGTDKESGKTCASLIVQTGLFLEKRANVKNAELGDSVEYSLKVKSVGGITRNVTIADNLPLGFKLIDGTVKIIRSGVTTAMANPTGSPGPSLTFNVGTVANKEVVEIRYRVRLGIGSDLGDGINKAQAKAPFATSSLVAVAKVLITRGVFTREACIAGKVFVDCNQNKVQDKGELGIPGVRLYMEDGTNITTDENGNYSICGVRAIAHVMVVDTTTMPVGSRLGITSNRNLGDGRSLMMNIKAGELYRADFLEESCYPKIIEQVEQRRKSDIFYNVPLKQIGEDKPAGIRFDSKEQELLHPLLCATSANSSACAVQGVAK
jgi:uncharacterized repeat protein (TIGR01451 family)